CCAKCLLRYPVPSVALMLLNFARFFFTRYQLTSPCQRLTSLPSGRTRFGGLPRSLPSCLAVWEPAWCSSACAYGSDGCAADNVSVAVDGCAWAIGVSTVAASEALAAAATARRMESGTGPPWS